MEFWRIPLDTTDIDITRARCISLKSAARGAGIVLSFAQKSPGVLLKVNQKDIIRLC